MGKKKLHTPRRQMCKFLWFLPFSKAERARYKGESTPQNAF
jgi:hypothetical protein